MVRKKSLFFISFYDFSRKGYYFSCNYFQLFKTSSWENYLLFQDFSVLILREVFVAIIYNKLLPPKRNIEFTFKSVFFRAILKSVSSDLPYMPYPVMQEKHIFNSATERSVVLKCCLFTSIESISKQMIRSVIINH